MRALALQRRLRRTDPHYVTALKALLYAGALGLYLFALSSGWGIAAAMLMGVFGMLLARPAHRSHLRLPVGAALAGVVLLGALWAGELVRNWAVVPSLLGIDASLALSDILTFGPGALSVVFLLRFLAHRARILSLLEVVFIAGSVVTALADHRNRMLNRPRFFSDWAWTLGIDPTGVLLVVGAAMALLCVLLFLREQPLTKLLLTIVLLLSIGGAYYVADYLLGSGRIRGPHAADALGLSGRDQKSSKEERSGKGRGGGRKRDNPFKDDYSSLPPQPVAIAILRDDYETQEGVIYFRQRVLSEYNGVHLTADPKRDRDVITTVPSSGVLRAEPSQSAPAHTEIPTTMYLLVDHPQPPALTHATELRLIENPNSRQFVAAYEVKSQVLSVPPLRLLGRASIPESWDNLMRRHYTGLPDDPRYGTLADTIVREIDPRFADDDLAQAFAIKRFLERKGFYTRRSTHASTTDPTASFLFGSLRGYCVHFAHAAVYLLRSQGLAARVALGYAVQTTKRTGGSSVLIMSDRAHAWPEIHLDGIGWVTFDIYPERTDLPVATAVDYDLEQMLGELARNHPTAGVTAGRSTLTIPWTDLFYAVFFLCWLLLVGAFTVKIIRQLSPRLLRGTSYHRLAYRALLDRLAEVGCGRRRGETRERHAQRVAEVSPHLRALTDAHMASAFGSKRVPGRERFDVLLRRVQHDLRCNVSVWRRLAGLFNPVSWLWSR